MAVINTIKTHKSVVTGMMLSVVLFLGALHSSEVLTEYFYLAYSSVFFISRLALWAAFFLMIVYTHKVEKQKLILWDERTYSFGYYIVSVLMTLLIVAAVITILGIIGMLLHLKYQSESLSKIVKVFEHNYVLLVFTSLTAGIIEELIFRTYLIPRLTLVFKKPVMSVVISSVVFGLMHFGFGTVINVLGPIFIGLVFGFHYLKYRNIKILILCHFLWDFLLLFMKTTVH